LVNLEEYKNQDFRGTITESYTLPLNDFLKTPEKIEAFRKGIKKLPKRLKTDEEKKEYIDRMMNADVLSVTAELTLQDKVYTIDEFFTIPTPIGWARSKIKAFREKNDLPLQTPEWVGEVVRVEQDKNGYLCFMEK